MKKILLIVTLLFISNISFAQNNDTIKMKDYSARTIRGVVLIKGTQIPIQRATVKVNGQKTKMVTDKEGEFALKNVKGNVMLSITAKNFIGTTQSVDWDTDVMLTTLDIDPDIHASLTSGGLGEIPMALLSVSSNFIKLEADKSYTPEGIANRIRTLPGMMMNSKGEILIRGENSLRNEGSSAPLWVVDGNVLPTENYIGFSLNNPTIDILSHIDVDDIATIAILKGSQGAPLWF